MSLKIMLFTIPFENMRITKNTTIRSIQSVLQNNVISGGWTTVKSTMCISILIIRRNPSILSAVICIITQMAALSDTRSQIAGDSQRIFRTGVVRTNELEISKTVRYGENVSV